MFTAALFTIAKICKQPKCPSVDEQIKKMYIYKKLYTVECYSAIKVNENLPFTTWMDLEDIMLSKINQTEKDKDLMTSCRLPLKCVSHLSHI